MSITILAVVLHTLSVSATLICTVFVQMYVALKEATVSGCVEYVTISEYRVDLRGLISDFLAGIMWLPMWRF